MSYVLVYNQEIHPKIFRCLPANLILCDKMIREDKHTRAMTRDEKREHDYTVRKEDDSVPSDKEPDGEKT